MTFNRETALTCVRRREGVTLVEVIFSIGVILIGMLGLLSVLTLAGQRAGDSISSNVGSSMGDRVIKQLKARRLLSGDNLVQVRAANTFRSVTLTFEPSNFQNSFNRLDMSTAPEAFCIDPSFASESIVPATVSPNGYSADVFPYFYANHNTLVDPLTNASRNWPIAAPRMRRVGISIDGDVPARVLIDPEQARRLVEQVDDLIELKTDASDGATLPGLQGTASGIAYGKRVPSGDFTWIATVTPLQNSDYASVAVVVLKKRERSFTPPTSVGGANDPQDNLIGERGAYVTYAAGFQGGAGGVVHLISSASTSNKIQTNDWIMLSRDLGTAAGVTDVVHRWYRVAAVQSEPEEITITGATGQGFPIGNVGLKVWRNRLLLEGSDWSFGFTSSPFADQSFADNTYATIVEDVVSVTERVVLLRSL